MVAIQLFLFALLSVSVYSFQPVKSRQSTVSLSMADKSKSLPFLPQPPNTVGYAGDVGMSFLFYYHILTNVVSNPYSQFHYKSNNNIIINNNM